MNPLALIFSESLVVVNSQGFVLVSFGLVFGLCWLENGFLLLSVLKGGFAEFILLGRWSHYFTAFGFEIAVEKSAVSPIAVPL